MIRRSRAREVALQLLYQRDLNAFETRDFIESFAADRLGSADSVAYCLAAYDGVTGRAEEIDRRLTDAAQNWRLPRMTPVDRNVLRLGVWELLEGKEPPAVVLNEAIELARRYGTAGSPAFVNGVLDRVRLSLPTPPDGVHAAP